MDATVISNAIFKLNDDCLAAIFRYLWPYEIDRMISIDQRFRLAALPGLYHRRPHIINKEFVSNFPIDVAEHFYQTYGSQAVEMEFRSLHELDFFNVLPYFSNLKKLVLTGMTVSNSNYQPLPMALTFLRLDACKMAGNVLQKWFAQVNATLIELRLINYEDEGDADKTYDGLKKLNNLTSLSIEGAFPMDPIRKLITRNKLKLRRLTLSPGVVEGQDPLPESIWIVISRLKHLKELHLHHEIDRRVSNRSRLWPELTSLELYLSFPKDIVGKLACKSTLSSLSLCGAAEAVNPYFYNNFSNIRYLNLSSTLWIESRFIKYLYEMQLVYYIDLSGGVFDKAGMLDVVGLERMMPNLKKLHLIDISLLTSKENEAKDMELQLKEEFGRREEPFQFCVSVKALSLREFMN